MTDPTRPPSEPSAVVPPPATPPPEAVETVRVTSRPVWRAGLVVLVAVAVVAVAAVALGTSPGASGATPSTAPPSAGAGAQPPAGHKMSPGSRWFGPVFGPGPFGGQGDPAFGGPGRPSLGLGRITITVIDGPSLTLSTADGWTRTITVTSTTRITRAGAAIALSDLKVGDQIRFQESRNGDGTYTITAIAVVLPTTTGTVTATTATTITIRRPDGSSQTIHVNGSTTYVVSGISKATLADVKVGMRLAAQGTVAGDGSFQASSVLAGSGGRLRPYGPMTPPAPGGQPAPSASPASNT